MSELEIFNTVGMAQAIRFSEYKDIFSAISEIVDNSIEAGAKNIFIISLEKLNKRGDKAIGDLAILDDGCGMNKELLHKCLVFGNSTRTEQSGMGRFGVGLGQASLFSCPRVEVFSWQEMNNILCVYLDTEMMKNGTQKSILEPTYIDMPKVFSSFLKINLGTNIGSFDFRNNGTLVLWKNVDKVDTKPSIFYRNLSTELGRKFRYYIESGVKIVLTTTQHSPKELIQSIDPLFISSKARILTTKDGLGLKTDNPEIGESIFEPFISDETPNGIRRINVSLENENGAPYLSYVEIKCSYVKEKNYYDAARRAGKNNPGDLEIGKELSKYDNISIVRAGREIQFDKLKLYNSTNEPENRWWSIEISFPPKLDSFFKLSNNKQKVEMMVDFMPTKGGKEVFVDDDSLNAQAWKNILYNFNQLKSNMVARNKRLGRNAKDQIAKEIRQVDSTQAPFMNNKINFISSNTAIQSTLLDRNLHTTTEKYESNTAYANQNEEFKQRITNYLNMESIEEINVANRFLEITKINGEHFATFGAKHSIYRQINDEMFLLGFKTALITIAKARSFISIYKDVAVFEKLLENINKEIDNFTKEMGEND